MLNLKSELSEYIEEGSINWKALHYKVRSILKLQVSPKGSAKMTTPEGQQKFVGSAIGVSQLTFQFTDKRKGTKQRLLLTDVRDTNGELSSKTIKIEPLVTNVGEQGIANETPMWVDHEWYKHEDGKIYKWLGRNDHNPKNPGYNVHHLEQVFPIEEEISQYDATDEELNNMDKVVPVKEGEAIKYITKKVDV